MLLLSDNLRSLCHKATVYLDTNVFLYASKNQDLLELLNDLANNYETAFCTVSSVEYEFTRGSTTLEELETRKEFIRGLANRVIPVGNLLESDRNNVFSAAMSLCMNRKDSQYTDFLLATCLHNFNGMEQQYVLSADVKAFPPQLFSIRGVISLRLKNNLSELIHLNLIEIDQENYKSLIRNKFNLS